jgi:Cdc6-like AAA superfamily ATPase
MRAAEWKSWASSTSLDRMLWIYGIPGSGKTVLASFAIERLKLLCEGTAGHICVYYYCHYSNGQDEALPLLSWVVSQVCRQLKWAPSELKCLYDRGCEPTIPELQHVLELVLTRVERLVIVVDAVDESTPRDSLVRLLANMTLDSRFQKVRILATSRQYFDIERVFSGISISISMKNQYVDADIECYIRSRLDSSIRLRRWRDHSREIQQALVAKAAGM